MKSDEFTGNQSLKLASGECKCEVSEGKKGVPQAKVVYIDGKENIDLLPLGWLWSRGCNYGWGTEGPTLHTPHGNPIPVQMWGRLPYITSEAVVKLFDDLPETNEPGRDSDGALPHACGARVAKTCITARESLKYLEGEIDKTEMKSMCQKYRCLPEVYYQDADKYVKPEALQKWIQDGDSGNQKTGDPKKGEQCLTCGNGIPDRDHYQRTRATKAFPTFLQLISGTAGPLAMFQLSSYFYLHY